MQRYGNFHSEEDALPYRLLGWRRGHLIGQTLVFLQPSKRPSCPDQHMFTQAQGQLMNRLFPVHHSSPCIPDICRPITCQYTGQKIDPAEGDVDAPL